MKNLCLAWAFAGATVAVPAMAAPITYYVDQTIGGYPVMGSITTDGTIGQLTSANIKNFIFFGSLVNSSADVYEYHSHLFATSIALQYDFTDTSLGYIAFEADGGYDEFYALQNNGYFDNAGPGIGIGFDPSGRSGFSGVVTFATVAGAVPEPAGWAMMLVGFGAAGASLRRGKTTRIRYS